MADSTLSNLPTATGEVANDALIYIVDDLASSTATSLQTQFDAFQQIRFGTTTATDSYAAVENDAFKAINFTNSATVRIDIPHTDDVSWGRGTWIHIIQASTGRVRCTSTATEVIFNSRADIYTATQNSMISLLLTSTASGGTWLLTGDMATA